MTDTTELTRLAIDLIEVRKKYGRETVALRGVNIQVGMGEAFGLLGPNGAGKSTLVKIMITVVRPDHAIGTILGRPLGHPAKMARIGYLPEGQRFPEHLTARQYLDFCGAMSRVARGDRRLRAELWLDRLGLASVGNRKVSTFSKGMRQKLGFAQAMINDPNLLILDEPTDGLDPIARKQMREFIAELRSKGRTIFLNSHILSEVEQVCDRVAFLIDGQIARQGRPEELTERPPETVIDVVPLANGQLDLPREVKWEGEERVVVASNDCLRVNEVIDLLRKNDVNIRRINERRPTLEEVMMEVVAATGAVARPAGSAGKEGNSS